MDTILHMYMIKPPPKLYQLGAKIAYRAIPGQDVEQGLPQKLTCLGFVKMHGFHGNPLQIPEWGCDYKITHISAVNYPRILNLVPDESHFFINMYESIKKCDSRIGV